jgi:hypothetical protein
MGKHQWLSNGTLLITDSTTGRAIEIDESSKILWDIIYKVSTINKGSEGRAGLVEEVLRLPVSYTPLFNSNSCASNL